MMELTPNDIRNQAFSSSFRGYAKEEVGAFKEAVATALEDARMQIQKLTQKIDEITQRYNEIKGLEETVKTAVIEAQKNAEHIVANARKEAELIITEAKLRRDQAIEAKHQKMAELEAKISEMDFAKKSFYTKLRGEIQAHLKLVDSIYPETTPAPAYKPEPRSASLKPHTITQPVKPPVSEAPPVDDYSEPPLEMSPLRDESPADEESPAYSKPPVVESDETKDRPVRKERPSLDFDESDIDSLVDGLQEEAEEVKNGQTKGSDF